MLRSAWFCAVVAVAALAGTTRADDAELKKTVKGLAEKISAATIKGDVETLIDLTHPKAVEELGGREKAITATKAVMKELKDAGFVLKMLKVGEPADPVRGAKELYLLIPTKLEMTSPQGTVVGVGYFLGVSADGGKTWRFVDGAAGPAKIRKTFPDLPEKFVLPEPEYKLVKD